MSRSTTVLLLKRVIERRLSVKEGEQSKALFGLIQKETVEELKQFSETKSLLKAVLYPKKKSC